MRTCVLALVICGVLGCGDESDDTVGSASSGSSDEGNDPTTAGTTNGTTVGTTVGTTASTTDAESTGDPTGMSGCESGPLPEPIAGCTPTPMASTGDFGQDCVDRINQFRWECQCLPPLARWPEAEMCTDEQSGNDQSTGVAHGNFQACNEFAQNTCPDWPSENDVVVGCLQLMWDEGPGEPFEEHGHYINMSSTDYSKVACGRFASAQGVWSNQNFSP